jgi:hypothetical protein
MALDEVLYKSLLDESKHYREKISSVWLQKLTILGAVIAFMATRGEEQAPRNLIVAAAIALPLLALLLGVRIAAYAINANVIDRFIVKNYRALPVLGDWECTKWGLGSNKKDRALVRSRSVAVVVLAVVPTCIMPFLSTVAVEHYVCAGSPNIWLFPIIFCAIPVLLALWLWRGLRFDRNCPQQKTSN